MSICKTHNNQYKNCCFKQSKKIGTATAVPQTVEKPEIQANWISGFSM